MSEIKFACPKCSQHIVCDGGYADLPIECPGCGQSVVVPRIDPGETRSVGPAAIPPILSPTNRAAGVQSGQGGPTKPSLQDPAQQATYDSLRRTPYWAIAFCATILFAVRLWKGTQNSVTVVVYLVLSAITTIFLCAHSMFRQGRPSALAVIGMLIATSLAMATLGLGLLFLGCAALLKQ